MTYEQAVERARQGCKIRYPGMGGGWTIAQLDESDRLYCLNPHTGSEYLFTPTKDEAARSDWSAGQ